MKRKVALRKLKRTCCDCDTHFKKGDIYYVKRIVDASQYSIDDDIIVISWEVTRCPKCNYKRIKHNERFEKFKTHCHHPLVDEVWDYMPGECVMQPDYDECRICGEML